MMKNIRLVGGCADGIVINIEHEHVRSICIPELPNITHLYIAGEETDDDGNHLFEHYKSTQHRWDEIDFT